MEIRKIYRDFLTSNNSEIAVQLTIAQVLSDLNETIKERFPPLQLEEKIVCTKCGKLFDNKNITECDKCKSKVEIYSRYIVK